MFCSCCSRFKSREGAVTGHHFQRLVPARKVCLVCLMFCNFNSSDCPGMFLYFQFIWIAVYFSVVKCYIFIIILLCACVHFMEWAQ